MMILELVHRYRSIFKIFSGNSLEGAVSTMGPGAFFK